MRASLKDSRHSAMEAISKRIIPDDLRTYIADFSSVLPSYIKPKQAVCRLARDPTERGFGRLEPSVIATNIVTLSEACISASSSLRKVIESINETKNIIGYDA